MMNLGPGATVDRYRLVAPAGEGGQGSVWRAEDPLRNNAAVALKLVPLGAAGAASLERFRREARTLARLAHPSLPRCHALFEDLAHDVIGIALDFVDGSPLSVLLASESLTADHRRAILRHLASALAYIHEHGLVHRDLKPQNVMIGKDFLDRPDDPAGVKLVDFGIAAESNNPKPLTQTGAVIGTVDYLAPELADRNYWKESTDGPERDVFALGVLAFELMRGKHPTGLGAEAAVGDYMLAYREFDKNGGWPPGIEGDGLEAFYRGTLALRPSQRAKNGAEALALIGEAKGAAAHTAARRAQIETAQTEAVVMPSPPSRVGKSRTPKLILGLGGGAAALFGLSFYISYTRPFPANFPRAPIPDELRGNAHPDLSQEEPPNPTAPIPASKKADSARPRPASTGSAPQPNTPASVPAGAAFPADLKCPEGMAAIAGPPPFCIDQREVTVAEYRRCAACGAAKEAYWVGTTFTEVAQKEQTANCTNTRTGLDNYPINCVSYQDATTYCAGQQKRLPRMSEWRAARSSISLCSAVGGVCPLFEWSSDPTNLNGYRATRGPSFRYLNALEGSNVEVARNDDLGFRCARDPLPR
jgi:serine/threonine-protein kinase